jgi:hypothetical protein
MSSLELYEKLVKTIPEVERQGATNPYTSVNGHMFSHLFLAKYKTTLFESYGVVKKAWAIVPDKLRKDTKTLQPYFRLSYENTKTRKPKK